MVCSSFPVRTLTIFMKSRIGNAHDRDPPPLGKFAESVRNSFVWGRRLPEPASHCHSHHTAAVPNACYGDSRNFIPHIVPSDAVGGRFSTNLEEDPYVDAIR